jgi:hypothetical protein
VTASELRRLFGSVDEYEQYEGGHGPFRVTAKFGEVYLTLCDSTEVCASTLVARLDDETLDDLELALGKARAARDGYRALEPDWRKKR